MRERWLSRVPRRRRREEEPEDDEVPQVDQVPTVLFVPVRCPRCNERKPVTNGVRDQTDGRIRFHICKQCRLKFKSVEVPRV